MFGRKAKLISRLTQLLEESREETTYANQHLRFIRESLKQQEQEIDHLTEMAHQYAKGVQYYSGLLDLIAEHFGEDAYRCDDGSLSDDPLRAKMPDLVSDLCRQLHYYKNRLPIIEGFIISLSSTQ